MIESREGSTSAPVRQSEHVEASDTPAFAVCDVVVPAQSAAAFTLRRIDDFRRDTLTQG